MRTTLLRSIALAALVASIFSLGAASAQAYEVGGSYLLSPSSGQTFDSDAVTLYWEDFSGADGYWLWVGTTPGHHEILDQNVASVRHYLVSNLPTDGSSVYLILWTHIEGADWVYRSYSFTAENVRGGGGGDGGGGGATANPALMSPANGSTLPGSTTRFTWSSDANVNYYWVWIGSSMGTHDLLDSGSLGSSLSLTVNGLPTNGSTVYFRLWFWKDGAWRSADYSFTAANIVQENPRILSPVDGQQLESSTLTLTWSESSYASEYFLGVRSVSDRWNLCYRSVGLSHTATVTGLPTNGCTIYVTLWFRTSVGWNHVTADYTAANFGSGAVHPEMMTPAPGTTLGSTTVRFTWSAGTGNAEYWLGVGTTRDHYNVYFRSTGADLSAEVINLPQDGSTVYVKLWYRLTGENTWGDNNWRAYTYTSWTAGNTGPTMLTPVPGTTLPSDSVTFTWSAGSDVVAYGISVGDGTVSDRYSDYVTTQLTTATVRLLNLPTDGRTVHVVLTCLRRRGVGDTTTEFLYQAPRR